MLYRVIERVKSSNALDGICVATTTKKEDDVIIEEALKAGVVVSRGSEDDVLQRYCDAAEKTKADCIVRVTADNPLTEPRFIDMCVDKLSRDDMDYVTVGEIPYGSNVETISKRALLGSLAKADKEEKEHVTLFARRHPETFKLFVLEPPKALKRPDVRVTLDTMDDYTSLTGIFGKLGEKGLSWVSLEDAIRFIDDQNGMGKGKC